MYKEYTLAGHFGAIQALAMSFILFMSADVSSQEFADLQIVKDRTVELLAGGSGKGPHRSRAQADLDDRVQRILESARQPLEWDESQDAVFNQHLNRFLGQIQLLAQAWASVGRFHADPQVLQRALADLDNALEHYNASSPRPGAWYYWLIPIPDKLGAIGLLLEDALPAELRARLEASLAFQLKEMLLSGANAAWEARNHAYLALLQADPARLSRAAERIFGTVRYSSDGGVREDFSYLFHGHIPYAGVYGAGYAETVAQFMYLFDDTYWAPAAERRRLMANLLLEHSRWFIVGGVWDPVVNGRVYGSRRSADAGLAAMLYMTRVGHHQTQLMRSAAVALIHEGMHVRADVAAMADDLEGDSPQPTIGFRYWYTAELGAWASDDYHIGFRQFSQRVQDYEYLSQTGGEGWNLAYGFTHITRTGREWFDGDEDHLPLRDIDWDRLSGTTSRIGGHPVNDASNLSQIGHSLNFGRSEIAGGAGLTQGGIAGFELLPVHGDFVARKSLTFFPGGYLAAGSGISSSAADSHGGPVQTTLVQWVTPDDQEPLLLEGKSIALSEKPTKLPQVGWCFIDRIGVIPSAPTDLWARRRGRVVTIWIDHGVSPEQAQYAFVVLPATTQGETAVFAKTPTVVLRHTSETAHVVEDHLTGSYAAVFFAAGEAHGFKASAPVVIYATTVEDDPSTAADVGSPGPGGAVAVQDPTHRSATLNITVPIAPASEVIMVDEGLQVVADDRADRPAPLSLQLDPQLGRIYRAGWGTLGASLQRAMRVDMADFYAFRAVAESTPEMAIFTIHLGEEPLRQGYELQLEGHKGHLIHIFDDADIVDRPAPGVVSYLWRHGQRSATAGDGAQREGDFRLILYTELKMATAYVTIPHFDADGSPHLSELQRDANRTPVNAGPPR